MKALTHYVFSAGLASYTLSYEGDLGLAQLLMCVWLSFLVNAAIDELGHRTRNGRPARTWVTHSVFTAPIWGLAAGAVSSTAAGFFRLGPTVLVSVTLWAAVGCIIALGHLALDSVTEGGVFWLKKRVALAHLRYNNAILNSAFVLIGLALAFRGLLA